MQYLFGPKPGTIRTQPTFYCLSACRRKGAVRPYLRADGFGFFVKTLFRGPGMESARPMDSRAPAVLAVLAVRTEFTAPTTATTCPPHVNTEAAMTSNVSTLERDGRDSSRDEECTAHTRFSNPKNFLCPRPTGKSVRVRVQGGREGGWMLSRRGFRSLEVYLGVAQQ